MLYLAKGSPTKETPPHIPLSIRSIISMSLGKVN